MERNGWHSDEHQKDQEADQIEHSAQWMLVFGKLASQLILWCGIVACVYIGHLALIEFAGKSTTADMALSLEASIGTGSISGGDLISIAGILFGLIGFIYGYVQNRLRDNAAQEHKMLISSMQNELNKYRNQN